MKTYLHNHQIFIIVIGLILVMAGLILADNINSIDVIAAKDANDLTNAECHELARRQSAASHYYEDAKQALFNY